MKELVAKVPMKWRTENLRKAWWEFLDKEDQEKLAQLAKGLFKG